MNVKPLIEKLQRDYMRKLALLRVSEVTDKPSIRPMGNKYGFYKSTSK